MQIIKAFFIAFSIYSRIPVPQLAWKEEDMKYVLCFFPWVGAVIGFLIYLWGMLCESCGIERLCYTLIGAVIPLLVTGGFHVDGFMDTMDAFQSYQPREKKLEILKDSHIGAFAVIMLVTYGLIYLGAFSEIRDKDLLRIVCAGFCLSRCLSGIGVISFPSAKSMGLLFLFADNAHKTIVRIALYVQTGIVTAFMILTNPYAGSLIAASALAALAYYYARCKRELGGITGDTAGYFVVISEGCMLVAAAIVDILG